MTNEETKENVARIVSLKPGTSTEKGLLQLLGEDFTLDEETTVEDTVNYVLDKAKGQRGSERIAERISVEMSGSNYAVIVNDKTPDNSDYVLPLFTDAINENQPYKRLDIIVAAHQQGGLTAHFK